jgi:15-cis-phytoene synthase
MQTLSHLTNSRTQLCEVIKGHSKSFYFATQFLPPKKQIAVWALYAFCRATDDLVDQNPDVTAEDLKAWRNDFYQKKPQAPILAAFKEVIEEYEIPLKYVNDLIDGCARDLTQKTYKNFEDLSQYCYQVASTVGLMSAYILGFDRAHQQQMEKHAIAAGVALQLTNILRDVGEDLERERLYLPAEDFAKFSCNLNEPTAWADSQGFKDLIAFEIARARTLYAEGRRGLKYLNWSGRFSVSAALRVYEEILSEIEENNYNVLTERAFVPQKKKIWLMPEAFAMCLFA